MKKYLVISERVNSKHDRDIHFISCSRLCELYGVNPEECIFADEDRPETFRGVPEGLIELRPDFTGKYNPTRDEELR